MADDRRRSPPRRRDKDERRRSSRSRSPKRPDDRGSRKGDDKGRGKKRSRSRSRSRSPERPSSPSGYGGGAPMLTEAEERELRSVFVHNLSRDCTEQMLMDMFSVVGPVMAATLIKDKMTNRPKGIAYVEFRDQSAVKIALGLTGQSLAGRPVMVRESQATKNRLSGQASSAATDEVRLMVSNLAPSVRDTDIKEAFLPYGALRALRHDRTQRTAVVEFHNGAHARVAIRNLDGQPLHGRPMQVKYDVEPILDVGETLRSEDEFGGYIKSAQSRVQLMRALARDKSEIAAPPPVPAPPLALQSVGSMVATRCIRLVNLFDPVRETDIKGVRNDVLEECKKFGVVRDIRVERSMGAIYVMFKDVGSALKARGAMNGRFFDAKVVNVTYITPEQYTAKFPEASASAAIS